MQLLKETRLIEVKTSRRNSLHKIVFCYHSPYLYFLRLKELLLPFWFLSNLHYNENSKWIRGVAFHVHDGNESILVIQWQSCLGWETWLFCCQDLAQKIIKWLAYQPAYVAWTCTLRSGVQHRQIFLFSCFLRVLYLFQAVFSLFVHC